MDGASQSGPPAILVKDWSHEQAYTRTRDPPEDQDHLRLLPPSWIFCTGWIFSIVLLRASPSLFLIISDLGKLIWLVMALQLTEPTIAYIDNGCPQISHPNLFESSWTRLSPNIQSKIQLNPILNEGFTTLFEVQTRLKFIFLFTQFSLTRLSSNYATQHPCIRHQLCVRIFQRYYRFHFRIVLIREETFTHIGWRQVCSRIFRFFVEPLYDEYATRHNGWKWCNWPILWRLGGSTSVFAGVDGVSLPVRSRGGDTTHMGELYILRIGIREVFF